MNLAVIGSRSWSDKEVLEAELDRLEGVALLVSGGARGADTMAADWARRRGVPVQEFLPDYRAHGRGAPLRRNQLIVDACDVLLAFWDGKSRGTAWTIARAREKGVAVRVVSPLP